MFVHLCPDEDGLPLAWASQFLARPGRGASKRMKIVGGEFGAVRAELRCRMNFANLSDDEVLSFLKTACAEERRLLVQVIVTLVEVEDRRIHLERACSSMFDFCTRKLGMSEGQAFRRITAARLVRRFPGLLQRIERGEIHLAALLLLRDHLDESNYE